MPKIVSPVVGHDHKHGFAVVAPGGGLHVAAYFLEKHSQLDAAGTVLCAVVPVAVYVVGIFVLYAFLTRTLDRFHLWLMAATTGPRAAPLAMAAAGASMPWCLVVLSLSPWVTVVGYELRGHEHNRRVLEQLARHGRIDLRVRAEGDLDVDAHHTVEDVGIALGQALAEAWGDRAGVERFGDSQVPIDEALSRVALDLSGRPYLVWDVTPPVPFIGTMEAHLLKHFFEAVVANARITLHVHNVSGENTHHVYESVFKAVAVALRRAVAVTNAGTVPSTKGVLQ
jgi:imidazoleglycerol-phosphate dehydratase